MLLTYIHGVEKISKCEKVKIMRENQKYRSFKMSSFYFDLTVMKKNEGERIFIETYEKKINKCIDERKWSYIVSYLPSLYLILLIMNLEKFGGIFTLNHWRWYGQQLSPGLAALPSPSAHLCRTPRSPSYRIWRTSTSHRFFANQEGNSIESFSTEWLGLLSQTKSAVLTVSGRTPTAWSGWNILTTQSWWWCWVISW